jgi:ribosomal protein S4
MARYTGPKTKKARSFGEAIYGASRAFDRRKYGPGQHGPSKRRKQKSDYASWKDSLEIHSKKHPEKVALPVKFFCSFWKPG